MYYNILAPEREYNFMNMTIDKGWGIMPWTEKDRQELLAEMERDFTPEQIARLPKAVQRGDRFVNEGAEWKLWYQMKEEFTWKKAEWQRRQFDELPAKYRDHFPKDVVTGKRAMTRYELKKLQDIQQGLWV